MNIYGLYLKTLKFYSIPSANLDDGCLGITYEPTTMMWTLRAGDALTELCGAISYLKECLSDELPAGVGMILAFFLNILR